MSIIKYCKDCKYYEFKFNEEPCISCDGFGNYEQKPDIIKEYCSNCGNIAMDKYCHKCNNHSEFKDKDVPKPNIKKSCNNCKHIYTDVFKNPCVKCGKYTKYEYKKYELEIKENCSSCKYKEINLYEDPCAHCCEHSEYELNTNGVPKPYKGVIATGDENKSSRFNDGKKCGGCVYRDVIKIEYPCVECSKHSGYKDITKKNNETKKCHECKHRDLDLFEGPCENCYTHSGYELKIKKKPLFSELYKAIESYNEQQALEINMYIPKVDIKKCCDNCYYNYLTDLNYSTNILAKYPCNVCINYKRWIIQKKTVNSIKNDNPISKTEFLNKNIDEILWEIYELILKQNKKKDDE